MEETRKYSFITSVVMWAIGIIFAPQLMNIFVKDKEIIYEEKNGQKTPITQKVIMPKIEGAIVTAEGASNPAIKTNIIQAVSAATGISTYRIQVFEMSI